jgi:putative copper export protein
VLFILSAATGWLLYAALVLILGSSAARWIILPRLDVGAGDQASLLHGAARAMGRTGALLLPPAIALVFVRQLVEFHDPYAPWSEDARLLLTGTAWGTKWVWAGVGAVVALPVFLAGTRGRVSWALASALALAMGVFPALTGHANEPGPLKPLTLTGDVLHVWAAGAWVGGLIVILYAERAWRARGSGDPDSLLPSLVPAFSPLAVSCVTVIVATGVMAAWIHVPTLGSLLSTSYGRRLTLKIVLVACVAGLGFVNWKQLTPRLSEGAGREALRRAATWELLVAQAVLLVTAILVRTAPPSR